MNNTSLLANNCIRNLNKLGDNLYEVMITERIYVRLQISIHGKWIGQVVTVDHSSGPKVVCQTIDQAINAAAKAYDWRLALPQAIYVVSKTQVAAAINDSVRVVVLIPGIYRETSYACRIEDNSGRQYPVCEGTTILTAMAEAYTTWQVNQ